MSNKQTYWQLIDDNRIEIPVIQRDYAQGREEDRITALRKVFVSDILKAISGKGDELHLGFIYGKVDGKDKYQERLRNKRAIENILNAVEGYAQHLDMRIESKINSDIDSKNDDSNLPTFTPLDGQQRLTTLYLIHWYLSLHSTKDKTDITNILGRFTYKTRKSSFEFCRAITNVDIHSDFANIGTDRLSEFIQKRKWFRRAWLKDSTVKGMLTMLDEIQEQFNGVDDKSSLFNNLLKEDAPIHFDFLDLNELNQTDELYVKMNARGKQLSEFEHFKAWLIHHVKENEIQIDDEDWKSKLDKDWLDMFWKNKGDSYSIDTTIYNFIKQVALFAYIQEPVNEFNLGFTSTVRDTEFIPFSKYEKFNFFNSVTLNFVFNTFNHLSSEDLMNNYKEWLKDIACYPFLNVEEDLLKTFIQNSKSVDRPLSVFYYSLLHYTNLYSNKNDERHFKTWMRMSRNLIFNTYIQNPENYVDAVNGIHELISNIDLDTRTANLSGKKVRFLGSTRINEEIIKLSIISNSKSKWEDLIFNFENHIYFRGDISLIFNFSKIDNGYSLEKFEFYGNLLYELFNDDIRGNKEFILQRALLTKGLYMPHVSPNYLFCHPNSDTLRARRDNWQKVFSDETKRNFIKRLIDEDLKNLEHVESDLIKVIEAYDKDDWMKFLIKSPEAIKFCWKGYIRIQGTAGGGEEPKIDAYLLRTSRLYGKHAELRSYYQYVTLVKNLESKLPFGGVEYWENRMSQYPYSCIRFKNWEFEGIRYKLEITYSDKNKYQFYLLSEDGDEEINQKIIDCCKPLGWQLSDDKLKCTLQVMDDPQLLERITSSLEALKKLI